MALFQQARRHAQGVAELGYVSLQHVRFMAAGFCRLSKMGFDARILATVSMSDAGCQQASALSVYMEIPVGFVQ